MKLRFRSLLAEDLGWLTEAANDPEVAKYSLSIYPRTEHEISEFLKKELEESGRKYLVAELDGEPAGYVNVHSRAGRDRHVAWLGIEVRRKHWGKGVGSALMNEAIRLAKELGCRKIMLGTTEGNERAVRLYKKFGFKIEAYEDDGVYIEGSWRKNYIMGLELAPCEPKLERPLLTHLPTSLPATSKADINVRQLMEHDLDELHRLQNCTESTKSSHRIPPITKEEAKRWYEELKSMEGKYCIACFKGDKILGYLRFRAGFLPFPSPRFEEAIVDVNEMPYESADAIVRAVKDFRERYGYRRIFAYIPETSSPIVGALEHHSFNKAGAMKCYYFVDGYYVDVALYGYP